MRLGPPPEQEEAPGQFWIDFIHETAPVFRKPTFEQLGEFIAPTFEALCDGARYVHSRLLEIIDELASRRHRRGQRRLVPGARSQRAALGAHRLVQPAGDSRSRAARPCSPAIPRATARPGRRSRRSSVARTPTCTPRSTSSAASRGAPPLPGLEFMDTSPYLNLYGYPDEVDYPRSHALDATWHNVQTSVRSDDAVGAARAPARAPGIAALSLARLPRLGRRRADAAPGRHPRRHRAPRDRLQGPARRADPAARQHVRRGATCRNLRSSPRSTS